MTPSYHYDKSQCGHLAGLPAARPPVRSRRRTARVYFRTYRRVEADCPTTLVRPAATASSSSSTDGDAVPTDTSV